METPRSQTEYAEFPGLITAIDPHDLPPGAGQVQVNATCVDEGQLSIRAGYLPVKFANDGGL